MPTHSEVEVNLKKKRGNWERRDAMKDYHWVDHEVDGRQYQPSVELQAGN